jgi:hypothetical protein
MGKANLVANRRRTVKQWILSREFKQGFFHAMHQHPFRENATNEYESGRFFYAYCKGEGVIPRVLGTRKADLRAVSMFWDAHWPKDNTPSIWPFGATNYE